MELSQQLRFASRPTPPFTAPSKWDHGANDVAVPAPVSTAYGFDTSSQSRLPACASRMNPAAVTQRQTKLAQEGLQPSQPRVQQQLPSHHYRHSSSSMGRQQPLQQRGTVSLQPNVRSAQSQYPSQNCQQISRQATLSASAERAYRNERAQLVHLENERAKEAERYAKTFEVCNDPNAIYYNYKAYLKIKPLRRGEYLNRYLLGLLANQHTPADIESDRARAIQYAKEKWWNYWELKDLDYVVGEAKKAAENKARGRGNGIH